MSLATDIYDELTYGRTVNIVRKIIERRDQTLRQIWSGEFKEKVESLIAGMDELDANLQKAEIAADLLTEYGDKIAAIRENLAIARDAISKPFDAYEVVYSVGTFISAVQDAEKYKAGENPVAQAKFYGKAINKLGSIIGKLPLVGMYGPVLEELGKSFAVIVANRMPEVHFKGDNKRIYDEDPVP